MNRIAAKLIDYGINFQYDNWGSKGENITSTETGIEVTKQNGKVYFEYLGEKIVLNEGSINTVVRKVEQACIKETT